MLLNQLFKFRYSYKNKIYNLIIIFIIMIITLENCFIGCGTKNNNIQDIKTSIELSNKNMNQVIK